MLSNAYFYHRLTRKYVILFGNMFNNITVKRINRTEDVEIERFKVPIVYAPKEKYYVRLRADGDFDRPVQTILPRMSFELIGFQYDATRKQNSLLRSGVKRNDQSTAASQYMSVPYNLSFELTLYTRNIDDGTHIIEQILPYFNPDYTISINAIPELGFLKDVPITLDSVENLVEHEGNFDAVRFVSWTLRFTMKANYYGPVANTSIIRTVYANIFNDASLEAGHIVRINTANTSGTFKIDDVVYQGDRYDTASAYGTILNWSSTTGRMYIGDAQGTFKLDRIIRAVATNGVCQIESFDSTPMKLAEIKIEPNPIDAQPGDDFGYTTTITEWPDTETKNPSLFTVDSTSTTVDSINITVDME